MTYYNGMTIDEIYGESITDDEYNNIMDME